jgi:hypothetical protein
MKRFFLRSQETKKTDWTPRRRLPENREVTEMQTDAETVSEEKHPFLLNRTITGSRSSNIASANERDAQLLSPRARLHSLRKRQRKVGRYLVLFVILCAALSYVISQFVAHPTTTLYGQVGDLNKNDAQFELYDTVLQQYLSENPLQRLPIFFSSSQAESYLQQHGAPEIRQIVSLTPNGMGKATVILRARQPFVGWAMQAKQYYVDTEGAIFSTNYYAKPSIQITDETGLAKDIAAQHAVTSQRFLQFVGKAAVLFAKYKVSIDTAIIPANTSRQIDFQIHEGPRLKLIIDRPVGEQCEDAMRAYTYLKEHNQTVSFIDVRVSGKAYYK